MRLFDCLALSREPLIQTTSHLTLHFLGSSSATHQPGECPFHGCLERVDCLRLARELLTHTTSHLALNFLGSTAINVPSAKYEVKSDELFEEIKVQTDIQAYRDSSIVL